MTYSVPEPRYSSVRGGIFLPVSMTIALLGIVDGGIYHFTEISEASGSLSRFMDIISFCMLSS